MWVCNFGGRRNKKGKIRLDCAWEEVGSSLRFFFPLLSRMLFRIFVNLLVSQIFKPFWILFAPQLNDRQPLSSGFSEQVLYPSLHPAHFLTLHCLSNKVKMAQKITLSSGCNLKASINHQIEALFWCSLYVEIAISKQALITKIAMSCSL